MLQPKVASDLTKGPPYLKFNTRHIVVLKKRIKNQDYTVNLALRIDHPILTVNKAAEPYY